MVALKSITWPRYRCTISDETHICLSSDLTLESSVLWSYVRITLHGAACLCDVIYVMSLICIMFVQFDCIVMCLNCTYMFM